MKHKQASPWRGEPHRVLPRFHGYQLQVQAAQRESRIAAAPRFGHEASEAQKLRGIPAIGRGVGGVIPGTNPLAAAIARDSVRPPT